MSDETEPLPNELDVYFKRLLKKYLDMIQRGQGNCCSNNVKKKNTIYRHYNYSLPCSF